MLPSSGLWTGHVFCSSCHMTCVTCRFSPGEHVAVERGSSVAAEQRSWGPLYEEPFILSGCFLYKNHFSKKKNQQRETQEVGKGEPQKTKQPEDASILGCNLARLKNKEPYTECPFFFWSWHHFLLNTGLDQPKTAAKAVSLLHRERTGNVNCDTKRIVYLLRGILRWNVPVFVVSLWTLFLLFWFSFHMFLNYSERVLKE